jgi:GPH family glycoside/pentoside/hexuronide:cation symporter
MVGEATERQVGPANSLGLKLFYGSGQAVDAIVQAAINTFLLFYLTAVCGMSGTAAGAVFLISLVVDGLLDPLIGRTSDHWRSRWGRRLPFMAAAPVPMAVAVWLMFSLPDAIQGAALFAYVLALNIILRIGLSVFALPHSALTAELTDDYAERSVLSGFRALFIVLGTAAVLLPAFSLIFAEPDGLQDRSAYPLFGAMVAIAVLAFAFACVRGIAPRVLALRDRLAIDDGGKGFFAELLQLFRNPSFVMLFVAAVLVLVGQGASTALNLHVYRYFWQIPDELIQAPLLVIPVGMLVGTLVAGLALKRVEKRTGVLVAVVIVALYPPLAVSSILLGLVQPGSVAATVLVVLNGALFGACGATCFVCFYSMIADAVDEHDDLFGVRREALYAAALMIGAKAATGLGGFLAGAGLQAIGFATQPGVAMPSSNTATELGLLWGPGASLILLAALPFLFRYRVDRQHHGEVLARLSARRHNAGAEPSAGDKAGAAVL